MAYDPKWRGGVRLQAAAILSRQRNEYPRNSARKNAEFPNKDSDASFIIAQAVAFGDFLLERPLVEAADVGIAFTTRAAAGPAKGKRSRSAVVKELRARDPKLNLIPYVSWMER